ncbi:MAG: metalloregulator ArsR/SmtB family transcription factor [Negativicutes bacterium]|nr:metalloregulator ArsR/SmtB family transcription factor [Negativicutes bacterium]
MKKLAIFFKALGDETRLSIVKLLIGKELCVCDIIDAFNMSQPAISHHLKILKHAGIVNDSRYGKWIYYSLNPQALEMMEKFLLELKPGIHVKKRCQPMSPNKI